MGKRMTTTQQTLPTKKPAARDTASPQRRRDRVEQPARATHIEPVDWRGEGVVSTNHTD